MNYSVVIIDDEEPLREAIKILGQWEELNVATIYEANNGQTALELLAKHPIDIALVDMKMPEMNGKQLLQTIEQQFPELIAIVISGYDDFEYTKQAIRSRVVDYLLKPINRQDLNQALRKATDMLAAKKQKEQETINQTITLNMSLPRLKEKLYLSLIDRSDSSYLSEDLLKLTGFEQGNQLFAAVSISMLNMEQLAEKRFKGDIDLLHYAITNIIQDLASVYFNSFSFANPKHEREIITIVSMEGQYREDMLYKLYHQMSKLTATLKDLFKLHIVVGFGMPVAAIQQLTTSYEQAKRAALSFDLMRAAGIPVIRYEERSEETGQDKKSILARVNQLKHMLETGNTAMLSTFCQTIIEQMHSADHFKLSEAEKLMDELVLILNDIALEFGVPSSKLPISSSNPLRVLSVNGDYSDIKQYGASLQRLALAYKELIDQEKRQDTGFKISEIKNYIDEHYYEDIKVTMFAEKYYLSREYLMKLFKQQYGKGIHEYVQHVRMEKAKALLAEGSLKIQEISEMLGYRDKNYFSKAFRNMVKMTPSEYRQQAEAVKK